MDIDCLIRKVCEYCPECEPDFLRRITNSFFCCAGAMSIRAPTLPNPIVGNDKTARFVKEGILKKISEIRLSINFTNGQASTIYPLSS